MTVANSRTSLTQQTVCRPSSLAPLPTAGGAVKSVTELTGGALVVDASGVFAGGREGTGEALWQLTFAGKTHAQLAAPSSGVQDLAVDGNQVFWVDGYSVNSTTSEP